MDYTRDASATNSVYAVLNANCGRAAYTNPSLFLVLSFLISLSYFVSDVLVQNFLSFISCNFIVIDFLYFSVCPVFFFSFILSFLPSSLLRTHIHDTLRVAIFCMLIAFYTVT